MTLKKTAALLCAFVARIACRASDPDTERCDATLDGVRCVLKVSHTGPHIPERPL